VGPYRGLNPTTKLVIAFAEAIVAFGVRGWTGRCCPRDRRVCAVRAGVARQLGVVLLATIPIVISILLIKPSAPWCDRSGLEVGPFAATWSGLTVALQATLRVLAFAGSAALLG